MSLEKFLKRCGLAPESSRFQFEVRQLLYGRKPIGIGFFLPLKARGFSFSTYAGPDQQLLEP